MSDSSSVGYDEHEAEEVISGFVVSGCVSFKLGLSLVSPFLRSGVSGTALAVATGLRIIWVAPSSLVAVCYLMTGLRKTAQHAKPEKVRLDDGFANAQVA